MIGVTRLLLNVWVKQFYIVNAGFLLCMFFFFFGMVNGAQLISYHRSLILAMLTSPVFMAVVWVAWLLYNIKCILFTINTIKANNSSYLYNLKAIPASKQTSIYLLIALLQYLPVFTYSGVVVYMAFINRMPVTAMMVGGYQLSMLSMAAVIVFITINKTNKVSTVVKVISTLSTWLHIRIGYYGFLLGNLLHKKKIAFALVKIFSILLLSISFVINGDHFDEDLFSIFFQLIFVAHATMVLYCVDFSEMQMQFTRNLPIPLSKVAARYLLTYGILLLPEAAFMFINNHGNLQITAIILLYLTVVSVLFLYTAILYGCGMDMESYLFFVFASFVIIFFLQKTEWQLINMLLILATAIVVFKTYYHSFEIE